MCNNNSRITSFTAALVLLTILCGAFQTLPAQTKNTNAQSKAGNEAMKMTDTQNGFYCNTEALNKTERERYNQLTGKLATARVETKELPDGYAFRLKSEVIALSEVAEWISWERKCCPFFGFEIALERHNGPLWLKLRGTDGVKIFIRAEFHIGSRPSGQTEHRTRNLLRDRQAVRPSALSIRNSLGQHSFWLRRPDTYRILNS